MHHLCSDRYCLPLRGGGLVVECSAMFTGVAREWNYSSTVLIQSSNISNNRIPKLAFCKSVLAFVRSLWQLSVSR